MTTKFHYNGRPELELKPEDEIETKLLEKMAKEAEAGKHAKLRKNGDTYTVSIEER